MSMSAGMKEILIASLMSLYVAQIKSGRNKIGKFSQKLQTWSKTNI